MRRRNPYTPKFGNYHDTWVTCAGVELDNCRIYFDDSPPEPELMDDNALLLCAERACSIVMAELREADDE